jgi:hypothetical protein
MRWQSWTELDGGVGRRSWTAETKDLIGSIASGTRIETLFTPGPHKLDATRGPLKTDWDAAALALQTATRLIVLGYSFPATDPFPRSFVLRNCENANVSIVVGPNPVGQAIKSMFERSGKTATDTGLLAQQFLAEGTAKLLHGRFRA